MNRIKKFLTRNWELSLLLVFILIAVVLRFTNITSLNFFTFDQSRDALFVKRMIIDHQWRLLGTQTSLPGMYLPPFYYYTIAPILWLSKLNPVSIDIYSAFIGVLTIPAIYFIANKIFGRPAGIFSSGLFAVSPLIVELTRRAWNPNTLPFFILITFYFIYMYFKEKKLKYFLLAFGFYGYCLSLHFGAWILIPLFIFIWFFALIKDKLGILGLLGAIGILFFFVSPLFIFEIRHNFFLTQQAKIFFFDGSHLGPKTGVNLLESFSTSLIALFTILISGKIMVGYGAPLEFTGRLSDIFYLNKPISVVAQKPFSISFQWWGLGILALIIFFSLFKPNKYKLPLVLLWIWIIWGVLISRMYGGSFFFFYYLFLFPAPILLFGLLGKIVFDSKKILIKTILSLAFALLIIFHLKYTTIHEKTWRDINDLKEVGKIIALNAPENGTFNIATIQKDADRWDRNAVDYRYFTETFGGKRALDWYPQDYQNAEILFVVDESGQSDPLSSKIMEISDFNPGQIIDQWTTGKNIVIYKISKKEDIPKNDIINQ
ncbi:hypothetical protein COT44_04755 [Candidatus Shapirobacteria bacterium CG08_land_8_20_14_0_20_39_18]|uniref:Glycosyltransferase RgtA/B/C/D-like domain-containing protein n=1 Tax=Candidatus Shapirobacteria bacterium CG08_land_8_20_14_0_20_39_18 TaxID=1974883 RepID=A0A2M6XC07_9BACT|nr:MAG: hypothetical protein COT44_04755 [Candidatus Shapirobacteria bacterium CG08_land_8_20_14_0_20_39_18]PIY65364.1 MAG: hypothetical protein COY91_03045 [Candidatus Shapirobacteria bacterium CG_4_10_14_0_8_um_filter_39_15]PJE68573.1 MAG: hypothetical protein COU94_01185 [Candidatus Shapirobacteria bacterium CG10_big_fil_rev_8_21_14_0_10_38_8]